MTPDELIPEGTQYGEILAVLMALRLCHNLIQKVPGCELERDNAVSALDELINAYQLFAQEQTPEDFPAVVFEPPQWVRDEAKWLLFNSNEMPERK